MEQLRRVPIRSGDSELTGSAIEDAWAVVLGWDAPNYDYQRHNELTRRWRERFTRLRPTGGFDFRRGLVLPEAMQLARILADLSWRRHVAMVLEGDLDVFYQHVATKIGADKTRLTPYGRTDPLQQWAIAFRARFALTYDQLWRETYRSSWTRRPFPEKSQFK